MTGKIEEKTITIYQDENPESPREWDNLGVMVCFHKRYHLGDKHDYNSANFNNFEEIKKQIKKDRNPVAILPLYLFDHSGLTISHECSSFMSADSTGWDWGQIGYIFVPHKAALENYGKKKVSDKLRETCRKALLGEIETYNNYLQGEVYGFVVKDGKGEIIDSCWGFYDLEHCKQEAKRNI